MRTHKSVYMLYTSNSFKYHLHTRSSCFRIEIQTSTRLQRQDCNDKTASTRCGVRNEPVSLFSVFLDEEIGEKERGISTGGRVWMAKAGAVDKRERRKLISDKVAAFT